MVRQKDSSREAESCERVVSGTLQAHLDNEGRAGLEHTAVGDLVGVDDGERVGAAPEDCISK